MFDTKELQSLALLLHYNVLKGWYVDGTEKKTQTFLKFTTRNEYLAWVTEWKRTYAQLTTDSRAFKRARKQKFTSVPGNVRIANPTFDPWAPGKIETLRSEARALLHIRQAAKAYSWKLKQGLAEPVVQAVV